MIRKSSHIYIYLCEDWRYVWWMYMNVYLFLHAISSSSASSFIVILAHTMSNYPFLFVMKANFSYSNGIFFSFSIKYIQFHHGTKFLWENFIIVIRKFDIVTVNFGHFQIYSKGLVSEPILSLYFPLERRKLYIEKKKLLVFYLWWNVNNLWNEHKN